MPKVSGMMFYVMVLLLAIWAIGLSFGIAGSLIHVTLLAVAALLGLELLQRTRTSAGYRG